MHELWQKCGGCNGGWPTFGTLVQVTAAAISI